jgi:hypothetical protein
MSFIESLNGMRWTALEFEEQAAVARLMREGKARIEGTGSTRVVRILVVE